MKNFSKLSLKVLKTLILIIFLVVGVITTYEESRNISKIQNELKASVETTVSSFKEISAGGYYNAGRSMAIDAEGNLWIWGCFDHPIIGSDGSGTIYDSYFKPVRILGVKFSVIDEGTRHSLAIDVDQNLWAKGNNSNGQLGNGTKTDNTNSFIKIKDGTKFKAVAAGGSHSVAIDSEGNLWTWGYNNNGQLGNGGITESLIPVKIKEDTKFEKISAGVGHSLAIDEQGNLWAWGNNSDGQLGNGTTDMSVEPIKIKEDVTFKEISAGGSSSLAIDSEGNLWAWGNNSYGQLGNGSRDESLIPIQIMSGTSFEKISAGSWYSMAIDSNKNLWTWGDNAGGQLGDGTTTVSTTPIKIKEDTKFKQVSAGSKHSIAVDQYGRIYTWGSDAYGQLGRDANDSSQKIPGQVTATLTLYTVTFMNEGSVVKTETVTAGESATAPELTKEGYTLSWDTDFRNVTNDLIVNAVWTANTNTAYKVEHYKQNTTLDGYEVAETENKTGTTDSLAVALAKTYEGFTENSTHSERIAQGNVLGNGSLVLKLYYDRNSYTITLNTNGGTINNGDVSNYTYGVGATLPTDVTKEGYTLEGWYANSDLTGETVTTVTTTDIGNKEYFAKWTANSDTAYRVEHYKQNITLDGYEVAETENKTGTTDSLAVALAKTYEGFSENSTHSERIAQGNVLGNGSLVLKLYYDRNSYTITLNTNGGTINSGDVSNYTYGVGATLPTDVTKEGYTLEGWYANSDLTGETVTTVTTTDIGNKEYFAKWTANSDTAYRVEHYKQNITLDGYEVAETENLTGTTDTTATAVSKTYEGFTENTSYSERVPSGNIAGDGTLTLKLYYDRNSYTITLNTNGGTINSGDVSNYTYGVGATLPTDVIKEGYTFEGWYANSELTGETVTSIGVAETGEKTYYAKWTQNEFTVTFKDGENTVKTQIVTKGEGAIAPELVKEGYTLSWDKTFNNITRDLTVNAIWTANADTPYKVEHYLRTTDSEVEGYDLFEMENLTGTTDTIATAVSKTYEGFTENTSYSGRVPSGNIAGDGSLVLKLYYDRNTYNITYELNGGTATSELTSTYTYGKGLILSSRLTKKGYVFVGWYNNAELTGETVTRIGTTEIGNKTYYAKWVEEEQYYITSEEHSINIEDKQITKVSPNTNVTTLINNINTNGTVKILNLNGKEVSGNDLVGTGYKVEVDFKGTKHEYEIAVKGDLDGNGKVTVTDLSILNQILVKSLNVSGIREKASDLDYSNKITITDLSMMNQAIVGKITL